MTPNDGTLVLEDAHILPGQFRNFAGAEGMYNREGDRQFSVLLNPELAEQMRADGWNVKQLKQREENVPGDYYLTVSVGFKNRPPRLVLISSKGRVDLTQDECGLLDWVEILKADIIIRPYRWEVQGKVGIKAYLKSLFITLQEDYLELKYSDVPYAEIAPGESPLAIEAGSHQSPSEAEDEVFDAELVE